MAFLFKEVCNMNAPKGLTINEALKILERIRYEAEYNSLKDREEALSFAIKAVKKMVECETRLMDDGK
jgi:hypothetical protein